MRVPDRRIVLGLLIGAGFIVIFLLGTLAGEGHRGAERAVAARSGDPAGSARSTAGAAVSDPPDPEGPWSEPVHGGPLADSLVRPVGADDDRSGADPRTRAQLALGEERDASDPAAPIGQPLPLVDDGVAGPLDTLEPDTPYGRFIDPCAENDGQSSAGDETRDPPCPPGVGATALFPVEGDRAAVEPLVIDAVAHSALPTDVARCRQGIDPEGTIYGQITTNHPAHLTIMARGLDGTEVTVEAQTDDGERARWDRRRVARLPLTSAPATGAATCFKVAGLNGQHAYDLWVRGIDDRGSAAARGALLADPRFDPSTTPDAAEGGRPPISVVPHDGHVRAIVPVRSGSERVHATLLQRRGPDSVDSGCSTVEAEVLDRSRPVSLGLLDRGDVPWAVDPDLYDGRFDQARVIDVHGLDGTAHDLCLWIVGSEEGSDQVVATREFRLTAPDRQRYQVHLVGNRSEQRLEAETLELRALDGAPRSARFPAADVAEDEQPVTPQLILDSGGLHHHDVTRFELANPEGDATVFAVPTPTRCADDPGCAPLWTTVRVPMPGSESDELILAVELLPADDAGLREAEAVDGWSVEGGAAFGADRGTDPGPIPVLDRVRSSAVVMPAEAGARPDIVVTVVFDRPVSAAVSMPRLGETGPCHREPRVITEEPAESFVVVFPSVCFGTAFEFDVLAITPDGVVADHRVVADGAATGRRPVLRSPRTPGAPVERIEHQITWTPPRRVALTGARLVVGGVEVPLISGATPCPGSTEPLLHSGSVDTARLREVPLGEPVHVSLRLRARDCETGEVLLLEHHEVITLERARAQTVRLDLSGAGGRAQLDIAVVVAD